MSVRLTAEQLAYLRSQQLPATEPTKIPLALRLTGSNQQDLERASGVDDTQLSRYRNGGDLKLSTAGIIADAFGCTICDLWPVAPAPKSGARLRRPQSRQDAGPAGGGSHDAAAAMGAQA